MRRLDLTRQAVADIEALSDFSLLQFGPAQTSRYLDLFDAAFDRLIETPRIGRALPMLGGPVHRIRCESHYIYYEFDDAVISILRVIHVSRDQRKAFRAAND